MYTLDNANKNFNYTKVNAITADHTKTKVYVCAHTPRSHTKKPKKSNKQNAKNKHQR